MTNTSYVSSEFALSIIIVAYKSFGEIASCLDSLPIRIAQGGLEVVVVDNYPLDGVGPLIQERFPWVIYIPCPENIGFGRANNLGYSRSSGGIVLYLNPDTICNTQALEECAKRIAEDSEIGVVSARLVLADGSMDFACRRAIPNLWDGFCRATGLSKLFPESRWFSRYNLGYLPQRGTYEVEAVNGAFMMTTRKVVDKVGGFDETFFMYGDDLDLCIRVKAAGYKILYVGGVQIIHLKGVSVAKDFDRMAHSIFDSNRDVYLKHFNPRKSVAVRWKYTLAFAAWKHITLLRGRLSGYKKVRPL